MKHSLCFQHSPVELFQLDDVAEYSVYELWSLLLGEQVAMNRQHVALCGKMYAGISDVLQRGSLSILYSYFSLKKFSRGNMQIAMS